MFDAEGARALARGLLSLAAAAEAAFDRRERAAAVAVRGWTGPLGEELARRTADEAAYGRVVVAALRAEAAGWLQAADTTDTLHTGGDGSAGEITAGMTPGPAGGGRSGGGW